MKKILYILLIASVCSCTSLETPKEVNSDLLVVVDTFTMSPHTGLEPVHDVNNPSRGRIQVNLSNYSDSDKTFYISVKEKP